MNNELLINLGVVSAIIITYLLLRNKRSDPQFDKLYHDVLNSDKYKVKGQYSKE